MILSNHYQHKVEPYHQIQILLYLNSPDFDFMCVITGKEDKDIAAACNLIYASGSFSSINWFRAFESSEWKEIFEIASNKMATYVSAKQVSQEN